MLDDARDQPVERLWLYLTEAEAAELLAALQTRTEDEPAEWHAHIESEHGAGKALTVAVYDPMALPDDPQIRSFLGDDLWPE